MGHVPYLKNHWFIFVFMSTIFQPILLGIIISEIECKTLIIYLSPLVNITECFKIFSIDELKTITLKQPKKQNAQYGHKKEIVLSLASSTRTSDRNAHVQAWRIRPWRCEDTRSDSRKHRWEENNRSNPLYLANINLSLSVLYCYREFQSVWTSDCHSDEETTRTGGGAFVSEVPRRGLADVWRSSSG